MPSQGDIDAYTNLVQAIRDNADYHSSNSPTKAAVFADSIRQLLAIYPSRAQSGGSAGEFIQYDRESQLELLKDAEEFMRNAERKAAGRGGIRYWQMCRRSV